MEKLNSVGLFIIYMIIVSLQDTSKCDVSNIIQTFMANHLHSSLIEDLFKFHISS